MSQFLIFESLLYYKRFSLSALLLLLSFRLSFWLDHSAVEIQGWYACQRIIGFTELASTRSADKRITSFLLFTPSHHIAKSKVIILSSSPHLVFPHSITYSCRPALGLVTKPFTVVSQSVAWSVLKHGRGSLFHYDVAELIYFPVDQSKVAPRRKGKEEKTGRAL